LKPIDDFFIGFLKFYDIKKIEKKKHPQKPSFFFTSFNTKSPPENKLPFHAPTILVT
jgi:hypothetical protein